MGGLGHVPRARGFRYPGRRPEPDRSRGSSQKSISVSGLLLSDGPEAEEEEDEEEEKEEAQEEKKEEADG